ncbi:ribonuclease HI [bacterium]|nr:ribonuclease HI [bacterium]
MPENDLNFDVTIYTDGACSGNPGPGGWGAVLIHNPTKTEKHVSEGAPATTNNRMEMTAVLEALKLLKRPVSVLLYSDSNYVTNAFNQKWLAKWQRNGWMKNKNTPVANADLWQAILQAAAPHRITWKHVPGHQNIYYNELCDKMAREQSERYKKMTAG